ncbi:GDSL esterase/lipase At5g41890-like [Chenopodium quinoa]|uniref:GDSL esterase/lipase At5g41890-like n=1 Tax=Chenopodium quinoa TaxID=63459 RepID=UPI000B790623|nr:GDSL esterase/lipase At5g41890-like [Chenopodium quinoa]
MQPSYIHSLTTFLFGDSLVDAGNNDYLFTLSKADTPPYGIDFSPSGGQPTGRFTNGRTVSDIIGQSLGDKFLPPPYLAPNTQINATDAGINYASGSAGILVQTGSLFVGRIPLQEQVQNFEQTRAQIVAKMGEKATKNFLRNAIFSITVGSNDILNFIQPSIPFIGQDKVQPAIFQDQMLSNLTMQLKRLHKLGASKFIVVGIGPLGCIPFVRAMKLDWFEKCSNEVNELIQGYNKKLIRELSLLNEELGQEAVFVYANSYDIFMDIISNYQHYGFENAKDPCCGGYFPPFLCFKGKNINTSSELCEDRSKYVFWDAYHPTEAANLIMAKKLLDGDKRVTSPVNLRQLYKNQN